MDQSSGRPVIELQFSPDEYLCTWHIPGLNAETLHLAGSIDLHEDRPPTGVLHGKLPLESTLSAGQASFPFPQTRHLDVVRATLANGGAALLIDATVTWWVSHGTLRAAAAVLTKQNPIFPWQEQTTQAAGPDEVVLFNQVTLQVGALDAIVGATPIGQKTQPIKADEEGRFTWSAVSNPASTQAWERAGDQLTARYRSAVNSFDFYGVRIRFSPVVDAHLAAPGTIFDINDRWVEPLRAIASLATGESQPITHLAVGQAGDEETLARPGQVFGSGLMQMPFDSDGDSVREARSVLHCTQDGVSLLDLIHKWWDLKEEHHPLIETYAGMLHVKDQHPRSRFLLLIQSLEGMHGHATRASFKKRTITHANRRAEVLAAITDHISSAQLKFVDRSLSKEPPRGLEDALRAALKLPSPLSETRERLETTNLVQELVKEEHCSSLGALRLARNGLAHGTRGFDWHDLAEVNAVLDLIVRANALRLLGCPDEVLVRLSQ